MRSWRRWPRGMSWPTGRWMTPNDTWTWQSADWPRCRRAGRGRRGCRWGSAGCCWPARPGDPPAVAEEAGRLQAMAEKPEAAQPGLSEELRALALISLGGAEYWAARFEDAERYLDQGIALARRIGRPYLEFTGLVYAAVI